MVAALKSIRPGESGKRKAGSDGIGGWLESDWNRIKKCNERAHSLPVTNLTSLVYVYLCTHMHAC